MLSSCIGMLDSMLLHCSAGSASFRDLVCAHADVLWKRRKDNVIQELFVMVTDQPLQRYRLFLTDAIVLTVLFCSCFL